MITDEQINNAIDGFVNQYFIGFEFRPYQREAIFSIIKNYRDKVKSQVISAPTGSGKSLIATISAGVIDILFGGRSFIICSDLSLFQQYVDAIDKNGLPFGYIKGHQGYVCPKNGETLNNAPCKIQGKSFGELTGKKEDVDTYFSDCARICPYLQDKMKALKSKVTVMTYQFYLLIKHLPENPYGNREFIVCDEAHKIPDIIQSQYSLEITDKLVDNIFNIKEYIKNYDDVCDDSFINWNNENQVAQKSSLKEAFEQYYPSSEQFGFLIKDLSECENNADSERILSNISKYIGKYLNYCEGFVSSIRKMLKDSPSLKLDKDKKKQYTLCKSIIDFNDDLDLYMDILNESDNNEMVKQTISGSSLAQKGVKLNCLHEDMLCQKFFHDDDVSEVLLSATFPKIETYRENIGLKSPFINDENQFYFEQIPSTFTFENSPIWVTSKCKMSYKEKKQNLPIMVDKIIELLEKHKDERGIIQTGSYEFSKALVDKLPQKVKSRILFYNNTDEKRIVLEKLEKKKNGVLVGPSLLEGLDLKDDLCRFIIVMKVPYASLGDALVAAKCKLIDGWYSADAMCKVLQGVGRGVRNKNDWCVTYILDGCFIGLFYQNVNNLPEEFVHRIRPMTDKGWAFGKDDD